jgi:hypothetical protein
MDFFMGKHTINIYIPEGYTIEKVPTIFIAMQENLGSFRFNAVVGNQIQISIINQVNTAIIPPYYSMLKEYYQGIIDKENEK